MPALRWRPMMGQPVFDRGPLPEPEPGARLLVQCFHDTMGVDLAVMEVEQHADRAWWVIRANGPGAAPDLCDVMQDETTVYGWRRLRLPALAEGSPERC